MIKELPQEVWDKVPGYVAKGLELGLGTTTGTTEDITAAVHALYAAWDKAVPKVLRFASPAQGMLAVTQLKETGTVDPDKFATQTLKWEGGFLSGSQELYWLYHYKFINDEIPGITRTDAPLDETIAVCEQVGWWWPFEGVCVVTDKPVELHMSDAGRLHNPNGPAVRFSDGYSLHALNGVRLTGVEHLLAPDAAASDILAVKNTEQRAELIKNFGIDRLFFDLKPKLLDTDNDYELYSVPVYEDAPRIYLKMHNPSVEEIHIEAVHPECTTVEQALNWRNTGTYDIQRGEFVPPEVLT